jgi:hypothetical protein
VRNRVRDTMAVQRYDVRLRPEPGVAFVERGWSSINCPVLGAKAEQLHMVHRVEDVTEFVRLKKQGRRLFPREVSWQTPGGLDQAPASLVVSSKNVMR